MRFPIRAQILLPVSLVMLAVVAASSGLGVWQAQRAARDRIHRRIREVSRILELAPFPQNDAVLTQLAGLTGAEFVLLDAHGQLVGTSQPDVATELIDALGECLAPRNAATSATPTLNTGVDTAVLRTFDGRDYFHHRHQVADRLGVGALTLHALYAADDYRHIWQQAVWPTLWASGAALAAALACAYWVGGTVSGSTQQIVTQLRRVAAGQFDQQPLPARNDELRDIAAEINRTASLLDDYESRVRESARMQTMVMMGAGMAHQLRNAATGCRLALDVHRSEHPAVDAEALDVAGRQLSLMENYLHRFLVLSKSSPESAAPQSVPLQQIVDRAVQLVKYSAQHLQVSLEWDTSACSDPVTVDAVAIEQSIVNLLLNAIAAAAQTHSQPSSDHDAAVSVVTASSSETVQVVVRDNGAGPPAGLDPFAAFATDKADGVGLGLAVVRQAVEQHGGSANWQRRDGWTEFQITLPRAGGK